jgi:nucleotide-binding universal stress UspA family protein
MSALMKVLVAYAPSDSPQSMLDELQRAGLPREAEAVVISVVDVDAPPVPDDAAVSSTALNDRLNTVLRAREQAFHDVVMKERDKAFLAVRDALESALRASEQIKSVFPAWDVSAEAYADSPAQAIIKKADDWGADLIVVGTHKRSPLERFILGSVSQKVVNEASRSVRVARSSSHESRSPMRILVGLDGSFFAEKAAQSVANRAWPMGSEVRLVTVTKPFGMYGVAPDEQRNRATEAQKPVEAMLLEAGLKVSSVIREGDAKSALVAESESWGADCIFVGSRGLHRAFMRFFLGSVSGAVVANATCSVEVVR